MEEMNNVVVEEVMDAVVESVVAEDVNPVAVEAASETVNAESVAAPAEDIQIDLTKNDATEFPFIEEGDDAGAVGLMAGLVGLGLAVGALAAIGIKKAKEAKVAEKAKDAWTDLGKNRRAKAVAKANEKREKENAKYEAKMQKLKDEHNLKVKKYDQKVSELINKACDTVYKEVKEEETKPEQEEVKEN